MGNKLEEKYLNRLLTAKERIVTKNAQAAKNHCTLQISIDVSSKLPSITMTDVGIKILDTNKSANAMLTINALPVEIFIRNVFGMFCDVSFWLFYYLASETN